MSSKTRIAEYVVTANELTSGDVVFRNAVGGWSRGIDAAQVFPCQDTGFVALGEAQADEQANIVMGAYLVEVSADEGGIRPVHIRERIRALGPTVRSDLAISANRFSINEVVEP
jgi:hypothetical protein